MPRKYLPIKGTATFLHHTGRTTLPDVAPELSRGEAVVCVHGAGGNGAVFQDLLDRLEGEHSPLAFDQPAHGRSAGLDSLDSVEALSDFTRALVTRLGVERPVLLGHSMGGAISLRYALDQPGAVRALVLVASAPRFPIPDEFIDQMRRVTEGKERRLWRRDAYSPATEMDVVRRGFMEDAKTDPRAVYGDLLSCRAFDARERLGELNLPVLVVVGDDEVDALKEGADAFVAGLPQARKVTIPKAGHMVPLEQPDALAKAVLEFLGGLPA